MLPSADNIDWPALMPEVARRLLGEPTSVETAATPGGIAQKARWRCMSAVTGLAPFKDLESRDGGGLLELIARDEMQSRRGKGLLRHQGLIPAQTVHARPTRGPSYYGGSRFAE